MKYKSLIVLLLAASPVLAGDIDYHNDIDPFGFEKEAPASTKTRAEVLAELKAAQAAGQTLAAGEVGFRFIDPPSTKTRAQVAAETREAGRLGLLSWRGEAGPPLATPAQEEQIQHAGLRALRETADADK